MRKAIVALGMILVFAGLACAQNTPQSLADVARKVRAERAKKDLSKVPLFTNDNIPTASGLVSTVGSTTPPAVEGDEAAMEGEGAAAGEQEGTEKKKKCDESCWRGKFNSQRAKIASAKQELDILQREFNLSRVQYYQDPNQAVRQQYSGNTAGGAELQQLQGKIDAKKAEIQKLEQGLSDLEDQLRQAGGDPGWARPE